uniref:Uncharacterized protein n=1 Tax=Triticum urartu TaxID=4572 RepID=A0A8R7U1D2_TRIUA
MGIPEWPPIELEWKASSNLHLWEDLLHILWNGLVEEEEEEELLLPCHTR